MKNRVDTEAADKATIAQLKVQVGEVIKKSEAAEANASREVREQLEAAEEPLLSLLWCGGEEEHAKVVRASRKGSRWHIDYGVG